MTSFMKPSVSSGAAMADGLMLSRHSLTVDRGMPIDFATELRLSPVATRARASAVCAGLY